MTPTEILSAALTRHPDSPDNGVRSLEATLQTDESGLLIVEYSLVADMSRLCVPSSRSRERVDGLWKHTCFEAFLAPAAGSRYCELNFSPSREWAVYAFDACRQGMSNPPVSRPPNIMVRRTTDGLVLRAAAQFEDLGDLRDARHLRIALAGVIEANDGRLSYWALRHPPGKPDFHHPDGFVLELARR